MLDRAGSLEIVEQDCLGVGSRSISLFTTTPPSCISSCHGTPKTSLIIAHLLVGTGNPPLRVREGAT
jgi:hypothetical protein